MIKKTNKVVEVDSKVISKPLNTPENKKAIQDMNEAVELAKRNFVYMNIKSEQSAREMFFTA